MQMREQVQSDGQLQRTSITTFQKMIDRQKEEMKGAFSEQNLEQFSLKNEWSRNLMIERDLRKDLVTKIKS